MTYSLAKDGNKQLSAHFKVREFRCKDGTDTIIINQELINDLERLYSKLNAKAINITSGYRTDRHSENVGGYAGDQHTKGNASDITAKRQDGSLFSSKEITLALEDIGHMGGVGLINKANSVHIDVRGKKCWFDETNHEKLVNSWYDYWGVGKVAKPNYEVYEITCNMIYLRSKASTLSAKKGKLYKGDKINVVKKSGNWFYLDNGLCVCAGKYSKKVN